MKKCGSLNKGLVNILASAVFASLATGCATPQAARHVDARDPWEGWNRGTQSFNDGLDDYFMKPLAKGYQYVTPSFVDRGVTNFFSNVDDIGVDAAKTYTYDPERGPVEVNATAQADLKLAGQTLLNIARDDFSDAVTQQQAKLLMRSLINHRLEYQPLRSRRIFRELMEL